MSNLRQQLPPLEPLVSFEAAARLQSFTAAARELNISQAAVSQQIRNLERSIGRALFERAHRTVRLTPTGQDFQHTVSSVLAHLVNAVQEIRSAPLEGRLTVATDQSVAAMWLIPRLKAFQEANPTPGLRIISSDDLADSFANGVDIAIVSGHGTWPGYDSQLLFEEEAFPVCSPAYLDAVVPVTCPADMANCALLDLEDDHWYWMSWRVWLTENGVSLPAHHRSLRINSYPLVIEAAKNGLGVALGWRHLIDDDLIDGTLVRPLAGSISTGTGYHIIWRNHLERPAQALAFCEWLVEQRDNQVLA